jgi:hypothetical protein
MPSSSQSKNGSIDLHLSNSTKRGQQPPDEVKNPLRSSVARKPRRLKPVLEHHHAMMKYEVLLIQVDGKLPNLALMKLAHWHRSQGHRVTLIRRRRRDLFDPAYDTVYASAIFSDSNKFFPQIKSDWPNVIFGGTGTANPLTVESLIGKDYEFLRLSRLSGFHRIYWFHKTRLPPELQILCSPAKRRQALLLKLDQQYLARRAISSKTTPTR